ncbi:MAG: hypothetical protein CMK09_15800 [Ponticaulis sp.]|nr:hypothetical protein [Ponticaulis sp.]
MAPRHKGGSPFLKTTSVTGRPRSQTPKKGEAAGACLRSGYALPPTHARRNVSSCLSRNLILFVAQQPEASRDPREAFPARVDPSKLNRKTPP